MSQNTLFIEEPFHLGKWLVHPINNTLKNGESEVKIQPKHMEVLTYLCSQNNKIVNSEELIVKCWPNQFISDNPIHKCIAELRKALGDSPKKPKYISTVPKRGYSVVASISKLRNHQQNIQAFWLEESPFRGLKPFAFEHKDIFYGRSQAVSKVLRMIDQLEPNDSSFLLLLGPSGCGKTSLIQAGIIPKLLEPNHPFKNNYNRLISVSISDLNSEDYLSSIVESLTENEIFNSKISQSETINQLISRQLLPEEQLLKFQKGQQSVLFIDQLELLFHQEACPKMLEVIFFLFRNLIESKSLLLILASRNEYYLELTRVQSFINIKDHALSFEVPALNYDELSHIIRKPAQAAGLVYELRKNSQESLDSVLINEVQSKKLPLANLQYTLSELYNNRDKNQLTYSSYESMGGIEGGIATIAENTYLQLNQTERSKFDELMHGLIQINPSQRNIVGCKRVRLKSFKDKDIKSIINLFINHRLFQTQWLDNRSYIFIAHESLTTHWPRLNKWVVRNMGLLKTKQDLQLASESWVHNNKDKEFLFRSSTIIQESQALLKNKHINFSQSEKHFLKASERQYNTRKKVKFGMVTLLIMFSIALTFLTISIHKKNQQILTTKNNAENLISFILFDLKDKLEPIGRVDLLNLVGSKTIDYFSAVGTDNLSKTSLLNWLQALQIIGESSFAKGNYDEAQTTFLKSNKVLEQALLQDQNNPKLLEKSSLTKYWLGYLAFLKKDYSLAEVNWKLYLMVAEKLTKVQTNNDKWKLEVSYALNNLGTLTHQMNELDEASDYFSRSIDIKEKLLNKKPSDPILLADLADSVSWMGKIKEKKGDLRARLEIYLDSLELTKQLIQMDSEHLGWNNRLSMAHHRVALSYYDFGQLQKAKFHLQKSINLLEMLVATDQENFRIKQELINNYQLLAKINRHQGNFDASLLAIQKGYQLFDLFKTNLKLNSKVEKYQIQLKVQQSLIMLKYQQLDSALNTIQQGLAIWKQNFSKNRTKEALLYVSLGLVRNQILHAKLPDSSNDLMRVEEFIATLEPHLKSKTTSYDLISMYLSLFADQPFEYREAIELKLAQSNYKNPDFLIEIETPSNNNSITQQEIN